MGKYSMKGEVCAVTIQCPCIQPCQFPCFSFKRTHFVMELLVHFFGSSCNVFQNWGDFLSSCLFTLLYLTSPFLSHLTCTGVPSTRLRSAGHSPLSLRGPVKALGPMGSAGQARQPARGSPGAPAGPSTGVRRVQSPGPANGAGGGGAGAYPAGRTSLGAKQVPGRGVAGASPGRGRLSQTPRR